MTRPRCEFLLAGPDDFVRLDKLCAELLRSFYSWLQSADGGGLEPETASPLASDADRYLRDFVIDILETGPADPDGSFPRRYLGNWYIVNTLTPSHSEMERIRTALPKLYEYLAREGIAEPEVVAEVARELGNESHFRQRLEDFWNLTPDAISAWRKVDDYRLRRAPQNLS